MKFDMCYKISNLRYYSLLSCCHNVNNYDHSILRYFPFFLRHCFIAYTTTLLIRVLFMHLCRIAPWSQVTYFLNYRFGFKYPMYVWWFQVLPILKFAYRRDFTCRRSIYPTNLKESIDLKSHRIILVNG